MVVTPLERPTAIAATRAPGADADTLHVAYYENEPYLKDNPYVDPSWEVRYRDRALIHQLRVHHDPAARRAWSTGHRVQMHYYVDLEPDADVEPLHDVQWRMSLPIESPRQRMVAVEPIGLPFELVEEDGQPVAVFTIPKVDAGTRLILGWRASLEVFGIKHLLTAADLADAPALSPEMAARYLIDDEDLDLDSPEIARATAIALGDETNVLEQARRLRSYVYDRLEYEMGNADSPIGVLARGSGSCGEHVGTIMALYRRAGLACRVAGRYKSPYHPWSGGPLYPDFNHVWVDLYLPGYGWVPVESNPDGDVVDVGPYPDRFFLGLPWRHVEVGKDISFEKVTYDAGHPPPPDRGATVEPQPHPLRRPRRDRPSASGGRHRVDGDVEGRWGAVRVEAEQVVLRHRVDPGAHRQPAAVDEDLDGRAVEEDAGVDSGPPAERAGVHAALAGAQPSAVQRRGAGVRVEREEHGTPGISRRAGARRRCRRARRSRTARCPGRSRSCR